jgi:hypothetical protein
VVCFFLCVRAKYIFGWWLTITMQLTNHFFGSGLGFRVLGLGFSGYFGVGDD